MDSKSSTGSQVSLHHVNPARPSGVDVSIHNVRHAYAPALAAPWVVTVLCEVAMRELGNAEVCHASASLVVH
jgi:hypothetical protein